MRSTKLPSWIEAALGLAPVPPPPHAVRLDGRELAYAGFERRGDGLALVAGAEVALDAETFQGGLLGGPAREPAALSARVDELMAAGGDGKPPADASLVVPDAWLRVAFADSGELPPEGDGRDDVLRWKLKRLVPFRVEELRLSAVEVTPLPAQSAEEPHRLLLGFAVDSLLTQVEDAFAAAGVRIGRITNDSLALLAAVTGAAGGAAADRLGGLVRVAGEGYTLVFHRGDEPVLHRYKGFAGELPEGSRDHLVRRDLRLTRTFLDEQLPGVGLGRVLVAAPDEVAGEWCERLADALGCEAEPLGRHHLPPLEIAAANADWSRLAPMVGAAWQEVA